MDDRLQVIYRRFVDANKVSVASYKKLINNPKNGFLFDLAIDIAATKAELLHSLTPGIKAQDKREAYSMGDYWIEEEEAAKKIESKYEMRGRKSLQKACEDAFQQILILANRRVISDEQKTGSAIMLLENLISIYLPLLNGWLAYEQELPNIIQLRKKFKNIKFNTVCHLCLRPLRRFNKHDYCKKQESRSCAEKHLIKMRPKHPRFKRLDSIVQCDICRISLPGALATRHFYDRKWMIFCMEKCYSAIRKREQRKRISR